MLALRDRLINDYAAYVRGFIRIQDELELILTRVHEKNLVRAVAGLRFLALDELHTYRGRQGADVSLLIRRARQAFAAPALQCVGTSATLAGTGSSAQQRTEVAEVASLRGRG